MEILTETLDDNEACYGVMETNRNGRRQQFVFVVRGDSIAKHVTDIGPASLYDGVPELRLLGMGDDTVAEMVYEANMTRYDDFERKLRQEVKESSTLVKDFLQEKEENWERIKNRSQFGPNYTKQRNGFSRSN